jgi:hypothetical protein
MLAELSQKMTLTILEHLLDALLELGLRGNTRAVDVVDTRADVAGVSLVNEDLEELGVRLGVLDGEDIGIQGGDGWRQSQSLWLTRGNNQHTVEEVLELGVAEVRVDLSRVLNTGGGQLEAVDGPLEVGVTLRALAERETLLEDSSVSAFTIWAGEHDLHEEPAHRPG